MNGGMVEFNEGETQKTHTIIINDNVVCGEQTFFSNIEINAGVEPIHVVKPQATITINDSNEEDCSECCTKHAIKIIMNFFSDEILVGYEYTASTTTEGERVVTLCAVVINFLDGSPSPFAVSATTEDGTAGVYTNTL